MYIHIYSYTCIYIYIYIHMCTHMYMYTRCNSLQRTATHSNGRWQWLCKRLCADTHTHWYTLCEGEWDSESEGESERMADWESAKDSVLTCTRNVIHLWWGVQRKWEWENVKWIECKGLCGDTLAYWYTRGRESLWDWAWESGEKGLCVNTLAHWFTLEWENMGVRCMTYTHTRGSALTCSHAGIHIRGRVRREWELASGEKGFCIDTLVH